MKNRNYTQRIKSGKTQYETSQLINTSILSFSPIDGSTVMIKNNLYKGGNLQCAIESFWSMNKNIGSYKVSIDKTDIKSYSLIKDSVCYM